MAQQQGLAFTSGGEAQEALGNPAEPTQTHHEHSGGNDRPSSGKAFEQLRRFSEGQQHQKAAAAGGITSRQAIFPSQVQQTAACMFRVVSVHSACSAGTVLSFVHSCYLFATNDTVVSCRLQKTARTDQTMSKLYSLTSS